MLSHYDSDATQEKDVMVQFHAAVTDEVRAAKIKSFLDSLPKHSHNSTGVSSRYIDLGTRRPLPIRQVPFLLRCMAEGMDYLEFAELTRRDWRTCFALYQLVAFMKSEYEQHSFPPSTIESVFQVPFCVRQ